MRSFLREESAARSPEADIGATPVLDAAALWTKAHNDCEPVARQLFPLVETALDWLGTRAEARLTGTGASVFAAFQREAEASAVMAALPAGWRGFVARGVDRSPLLETLASC